MGTDLTHLRMQLAALQHEKEQALLLAACCNIAIDDLLDEMNAAGDE